MSQGPRQPIPAAWYPDPDGADQWRWWNGYAWTEYVSPMHPHSGQGGASPLFASGSATPTKRDQPASPGPPEPSNGGKSRIWAQLGSSLSTSGFALAPEQFTADPVLGQDAIQRATALVQPHSRLTGIKFSVGQPVMVGCVDANGLSLEGTSVVADAFERAGIELLDISARLAMGTRGSASVIILFVFETSPPGSFLNAIRKQCKRRKFWQKVSVVSWCILVDKREVIPHGGLPVITYLLNAAHLSEQLFRS